MCFTSPSWKYFEFGSNFVKTTGNWLKKKQNFDFGDSTSELVSLDMKHVNTFQLSSQNTSQTQFYDFPSPNVQHIAKRFQKNIWSTTSDGKSKMFLHWWLEGSNCNRNRSCCKIVEHSELKIKTKRFWIKFRKVSVGEERKIAKAKKKTFSAALFVQLITRWLSIKETNFSSTFQSQRVYFGDNWRMDLIHFFFDRCQRIWTLRAHTCGRH